MFFLIDSNEYVCYYISTAWKKLLIILRFTNVIFTDGITMVGFQRLGTVRGFKFEQRPLPMVKDRNRSGSDPLHLYSSSSDENVRSPKYNEFDFHISRIPSS